MADKESTSPVTVLTVVGTRPELIKLGPVVRELRQGSSKVRPIVCFSGQHRELLDSVARPLGISPDVDLEEPLDGGSLSASLAGLLERLDRVVGEVGPHGVIVQGDTNSALAGALAGFHNHLPVFHVEAGLRTDTPFRPFPEEMNRRLIARLATLHFAPTAGAKRHLVAEGVAGAAVRVTGNTIIDAMGLYGPHTDAHAREVLGGASGANRRVLVTLHRRENIELAENVAAAARRLIGERDEVEVIWILHLNATRPAVRRVLDAQPRARLLEPQPYDAFLGLLRGSAFVLTDSGGVQEEAPALGVPTLVLRSETERPEAVELGCAAIVGADEGAIVRAASELLDDPRRHARMSQKASPFGDGRAAERIARAVEHFYVPRVPELDELSVENAPID